MKMRKSAQVVSVTKDFVAVRHGVDITDVEYLYGLSRPKMVQAGDRGFLVYNSGGSIGYWTWESV